MPDHTQLLLDDLTARYAEEPISEAFLRLYGRDVELGRTFASLHQRLNEHFDAVNGRIRTTHHYWADNSRELLALISELTEVLHDLREAGFNVDFSNDYSQHIAHCRIWLKPTEGSTIPDGLKELKLIKYQPVFSRSDFTVKGKKRPTGQQLTIVGEGSYAIVYVYTDPDYGKKIALKRAKKDLDQRDLLRFRQEFDTLKSLSFPYIVDVYQYDESRNEYSMEYCDTTLRSYIRQNNKWLSFATRKRVALQFLYGINYLHHKDLLHRDISLQNALVKTFDAGAVLVKLSDFGLVKDQSSTFTRTGTEMRGTIRDPYLHNFKDYNHLNEIYAIGWVLSYVFTGRESLKTTDELGRIIQKCTSPSFDERYQKVADIISDVERLDVLPDSVAPA
ncbi:protein kinase family protein [Nocardia lijiangensis]|uniref:protein kinase family protein n=1 Tax=Nocardia lijiangensis TaxID=299618 RepID=UPI003D703980